MFSLAQLIAFGRLISASMPVTPNAAKSPTVLLPSGGKVIGVIENGLPSYLGIRYASAARFEKPLLWTLDATFPVGSNILNATTRQQGCLQSGNAFDPPVDDEPIMTGEEDCHFLNIITPVNLKLKKAVMFYMHGGCLQAGSGMDEMSTFDSMVSDGDVIVVTINYRLALMGFFTPQDPLAPKNFGIRDQVAALQWVQTHIEYFGGDHNAVTIFGESAGGLSVLALYHSPMAVGLFHRAIAQSPGFQSPGQLQRPWTEAASSMSATCMQNAGCSHVKCLQEKSADELFRACPDFFPCGRRYLTQPGAVFAGFDGEVLPSSMWEASCHGRPAASADKPLIVGNTPHEFRLFYNLDNSSGGIDFNLTGIEDVFLNEHLVGYSSSNDQTKTCIRKKLRSMYANVPKAKCEQCHVSGIDVNRAMIEMISDMNFVLGSQLQVAEPGAPRYRYIFDMGEDEGPLGCTHSDDVCYISGPDCKYQNVSRTIHHIWSHFAKTGVPYINNITKWEPVDRSTGILGLPLLQIQPSSVSMIDTVGVSNETAALLGNMACKRVSVKSSSDGQSCFLDIAPEKTPSPIVATDQESGKTWTLEVLSSVAVIISLMGIVAYRSITQKERRSVAHWHCAFAPPLLGTARRPLSI